MFLRTVVVLLLVTTSVFGLLGRMKKITVTGRLNCDRLTSRNTKVELWEDDTLNFDDKLNTTFTDGLGRFRVYGQAREIRNIEPYLLIYHNCENGKENSVSLQANFFFKS
ncbi:unnamed protein product [Enterobius vermicularis]|uniref:Transthyretin-like family protein n=1 Tax=Enterobius vermicularis TaxID=51028 RepID=A0A0N4UTU8_ENTVE|nr:unnamed protein product [Enterobius vermicularis]